jgi:hypothetical protein
LAAQLENTESRLAEFQLELQLQLERELEFEFALEPERDPRFDDLEGGLVRNATGSDYVRCGDGWMRAMSLQASSRTR